MDFHIDVNDLTLGEVEVFEQLSGQSLDDLLSGRVTTTTVLALITVTQRRENPDYGMEDARAVRIGELILDGAADPTEAQDEPESGPPSPTTST